MHVPARVATHVLPETGLVLVDGLMLELLARVVNVVLDLVEVLCADAGAGCALDVAAGVVGAGAAETAHGIRWLEVG
jgi:hypothetical protein